MNNEGFIIFVDLIKFLLGFFLVKVNICRTFCVLFLIIRDFKLGCKVKIEDKSGMKY